MAILPTLHARSLSEAWDLHADELHSSTGIGCALVYQRLSHLQKVISKVARAPSCNLHQHRVTKSCITYAAIRLACLSLHIGIAPTPIVMVPPQIEQFSDCLVNRHSLDAAGGLGKE